MCSGDSRDWFIEMAVFPCGMLWTAVSYPVSEDSWFSHSLSFLTFLYWSLNPSSPPTFSLCLPICKLLILSPCKPLVAHESISSLVPPVPIRAIHRAQLLSLAERWQYLGFSPDFSFSLSGLCCTLPMCKFRSL